MLMSSRRKACLLICVGMATFFFCLWVNILQLAGEKLRIYYGQDVLHNMTGMDTDDVIIKDNELWQDILSKSEKIKGSLATTCKHLGYTGVLSDQGKKYNNLTNQQRDYLLVDDAEGAVYCRVPKVGMSNWHRVFVFLTGKMSEKHLQDIPYPRMYLYYRNQVHYIKYITSYSDKQAIPRVENYFKFVFIRDPFERLVSAYRHMIEKHSWQHVIDPVRKYLARNRQEPETEQQDANGSNTFKGHTTSQRKSGGNLIKQVTFEEFAAYVVDSHGGKEYDLDEHLRPQHILCNPCLINFDFIGKYNTINAGADYVLHKLGVADRVSYPARNLSYKHSRSNNVLWSYYDAVPYDTLWKIYRLYYADYLLFDFPPPKFLETLKQGWHS